ncbi:thiol:disulfide interchange protein DsbG [Paraburkholderia phymatum]|uniref:thiol:disulfide interchange protein DsbG n=1 Tax=Paraburkholderia phymatum TaxID=148447 RepID=UPI0031721FB2
MTSRTKFIMYAASALTLTAAASALVAMGAERGRNGPPGGTSIPAALQTLSKETGMQIVGPTLPALPGMKGWAAFKGQQPLAFYSTDDGKYVIVGTMIDAQANDLTKSPLEKAVGTRLSGGVWGQLEHSHWIVDGNPAAQRIVYVFTDPNCPYCSRLWADSQPWVKAGKVQVRNIIVGILTPTSYGKAAALLAAQHPEQAFRDHEATQYNVNANNAPGHMKSLDSTGIAPLATIDAATKRKLDENGQLMAALGADATPALYWEDAHGLLQTSLGAPSSQLAAIFGAQ